MSLATGTRIGHYQVTGSLGAGGMGEVYRARDTKLDRDVALKILPETFAGDPERRARFTREAKTLAALNHTHIAQIYGVEDSGATSALVMELVEGEDLSERIRRGPLSYDDAIAIAKQIAQALEAAHEQGIIHRDLKPANIKLRDDGTIKILDFGLAKALDRSGGAGGAGRAGGAGKAGGAGGDGVLDSPTITSPAMTAMGMIIGTAAYMSPEQARGKVVDKRADIWAFGCVLYEMLTGRRTFAGDDVSDTLAAVLRSDVDLSRVPPSVRRLLAKCLEKDPKRRLHDIGDAWDLIDDGQRSSSGSARMLWLGWGLAAVFLASAVAVAMLHFSEAPARPTSARFQIAPPPNTSFEIYLTLSPDGRRLAFTAAEAGGALQLWVRDLESLEARRLPGTEGAASPFWSPDGRYLGFAEGPRVKKIDIEGGLPQVIAESPTGNAGVGAWSKDGVIVFGSRTTNVGIRRVPATGGTPVEVTTVDTSAGENLHSFPFFLPDGRHFLYYCSSNRPEVQGIYIGSIDGPVTERTGRLLEASLGPVMTAADGPDTKLFFVRDGTLMAQSFSADSAQLSGTPIPVAERIGNVGSFAFFSVASNVLAYRTGTATSSNLSQLFWVGRKGELLGNVGEPRQLSSSPFSVSIAPNGRQAAIMVTASAIPSPDIWTVEFARGIATRVTFDAAADSAPVWSPDFTRITFRSNRGNAGNIYETDLAGTTKETVLLESPEADAPTDWSFDGRFLLFNRLKKTVDLWVLPAKAQPATPVPLLETPFAEQDGRFSPDGRWIAYTSNESGEEEIYLRPFAVGSNGAPAVGPKWRVSTAGGASARWRRDGKELFYRDRSGAIVAVDVVDKGTSIETGAPRPLFTPSLGMNSFDVHPDGQRFLLSGLLSFQATSPDPVTVVLNWTTVRSGQ